MLAHYFIPAVLPIGILAMPNLCWSMVKIPDEWIMDDRDWETEDVASFEVKFPKNAYCFCL